MNFQQARGIEKHIQNKPREHCNMGEEKSEKSSFGKTTANETIELKEGGRYGAGDFAFEGIEEPPLIKEQEGEDFNSRYDTHKLFLGLPRHIMSILIVALFFFALGGLASFYFLTNYQAESIVVFNQEERPVQLFGGATLPVITLPTALELIKLPVNLDAVRKILGLDLTNQQLEGMIDVPTPRNNSNLIRIVAKGDNPHLIIDIANVLAKVSVKASQEFTQKQLKQQLENYKGQLETVTQRLNSQMKDIEDFKEQNRYLEMTAEHLQFLTLLNDARSRLQNATLRYNGLLVEYENLKREIQNLPDQISVPQNTVREAQLNPMQARILTLETSLIEARARYAKDNPKLKAMEAELQVLTDKLKEGSPDKEGPPQFLQKNDVKEKLQIEAMRMDGKVRSAQKMKEDLSLTVAQLEKEIGNLPAKQITFAKLLHSKQITEDELKYLNKAVDTTQLMINVPKGSIELYNYADKAKPLRDSLFVYLLPLLGFLLGAGLGSLLAIFQEMRDDKFRTIRQVELAYDVPALVSIPYLSDLNRSNAEDKTLFFIRDLVEHLERSSLAFQIAESNIAIGVTSSLHGEGKSLLAFELAQYFKRVGKKAILLETDFRPSIFTEGVPRITLESYLKNPTNLSDLIISGGIDRIRVGLKRDFAMKELIKSQNLKNLWTELKGRYDIIVMDIPGLLEEDYALNLFRLSDAGVFVIDSTDTTKRLIDQSLSLMDAHEVRPVGIILNRVLTAYIDDQRTLNELKRTRKGFFEKLMFWKKE